MLLLNSTVGAEEAARLGLLTELVDDDALVEPRARELAATLAVGPSLAYAQIKRQLRFRGDFDAALDSEAAAQAACGFSTDHVSAVDSFVAKKKPTFHGR